MKKLYQSDERKIFGVCGGLAEYFELDATLVRVAWVITTIITGFVPGILAYLVVAMVMPKTPAAKTAG